jgi:hypothetical protein
MNNPKKQVLKAIQKLGNRVTVADVVARSGYSLQESTILLNEIAAETSATLQVSADGRILYCFHPNFQYLYLSRGTAKVLSFLRRTFGPVLFFLFKISFGVTLMLSVIIVFGIILILRSLLSVGTDSGESVSLMWGDFFLVLRRVVWLDFRSLREARTQRRLSAELTTMDQTTGEQTTAEHTLSAVPSGQGFLLDCYYFLFGPGDPNEGVEESRWKLIAQSIRLNEGVILAEHLVPYTGRPPEDERTLFSILAKFNGAPFVSESGNIFYTFPSMASRSDVASYAFTAPLVQEKEWQFTGLSRQALKPVILLAVANLLGAGLFYMLIAMIGGRHAGDLRLFQFFSVYGVLFLVIPAVRYFVVQNKNRRIRENNEIAREYEEKIGKPDIDLARKLEEAEQFRRHENAEQSKQIVYRTDQDYLEQISDAEFVEKTREMQ